MMNYSIRWIGQGGFILKDLDAIVCIDPYLSDIVEKRQGLKRLVPYAVLPEELDAGLIICTHNHMDHLDEDTISRINPENKSFAGPNSCQIKFAEIGILQNRRILLDRDMSIEFKGFKITAVYANHTLDSIGLLISHKSVNIYISGDTLYDQKLMDMAKFNVDVAIICINGKLGNMNVNEAISLTNEIKAKVGIPTHYGMFMENTEDPKIYIDGLKGTGAKGFQMEYNTEYDLSCIL